MPITGVPKSTDFTRGWAFWGILMGCLVLAGCTGFERVGLQERPLPDVHTLWVDIPEGPLANRLLYRLRMQPLTVLRVGASGVVAPAQLGPGEWMIRVQHPTWKEQAAGFSPQQYVVMMRYTYTVAYEMVRADQPVWTGTVIREGDLWLNPHQLVGQEAVRRHYRLEAARVAAEQILRQMHAWGKQTDDRDPRPAL